MIDASYVSDDCLLDSGLGSGLGIWLAWRFGFCLHLLVCVMIYVRHIVLSWHWPVALLYVLFALGETVTIVEGGNLRYPVRG